MDLVTFLITTYNSEQWINECLNSVLNQTHKNLQVLIIDDGSEDNTVDRIKQIPDKRIELYSKEHSGISKSLNFALDKIKGDFAAKLGSDDFCDIERISKQLRFLKENKSYKIIGSNFILVDEAGEQIDKVKNPEKHKDIIEQLPRRCCIWDGSVLMRKDLINHLNGYSEQWVTGEDWDFFLRAIGSTKIYNIQEFLSTKRLHPASMSFSDSAFKDTEDIILSYNNSIIKKSNDEKKIGNAYFNIGYHYYYAGDFKKANEHFEKAIKYCKTSFQLLRYYLSGKYLNKLITSFRNNKIYRVFYLFRIIDRNNKFFRNKF